MWRKWENFGNHSQKKKKNMDANAKEVKKDNEIMIMIETRPTEDQAKKRN